MRTLSLAIYTPAGIISDVETVLNMHLIVQRKQSAGTRIQSLIPCSYQGKTSEPMRWQPRRSRTVARASGIIGARLIINYLVVLGHRAFATLRHQCLILCRAAEMSFTSRIFFSSHLLAVLPAPCWHLRSPRCGRREIRACSAKRSLSVLWMVQYSTFIEIY